MAGVPVSSRMSPARSQTRYLRHNNNTTNNNISSNNFDESPQMRSTRTSSTRLSTWRKTRPSLIGPELNIKANSQTVPVVVSPKPPRRRTLRRLFPPPPFVQPDPAASITAFLSSSVVSKGSSESSDSSFKPFASLLRRLTLHNFDIHRYLAIYKPLNKAYGVLAVHLLNALDTDSKNTNVSPVLRSAAAYVAANAQRSVFAMVMAAELKALFKPRPTTEDVIGDIVLTGEGLALHEISALDFVQELSSDLAVVSENTKRRVIDGTIESDGQLERIICGYVAFFAFFSRLTSIIDFELSYEAVHYATRNLQGLPWKPSGGHFLIKRLENELDDPFVQESVGSGGRRRLKARRRSARVPSRVGSGSTDRKGNVYSNVWRMSSFISNTITAPRLGADISRTTDAWMRTARVPPPGQIFEMNDYISHLWGFEPFFLSTTAMASEQIRRAYVLAAKELIFTEKEVSMRTKFIVCYVLAKGSEKARDKAKAEAQSPKHHGESMASMPSLPSTPLKNPPSEGEYDGLSIMTAHAAYLACKHGATPAELKAAADYDVVKEAIAGISSWDNSNESDDMENIDANQVKRDLAAAGLAHCMATRPGRMKADVLAAFEGAYGSTLKKSARGGRLCHRALLEIIGTGSMWAALERLACGALAFDTDFTSNMVFGTGRAEPVIMEFAQSTIGQDVELTLQIDEVTDIRNNARIGRGSSLYGLGGSARSSPSLLRRVAQRTPSLRRSAGIGRNSEKRTPVKSNLSSPPNLPPTSPTSKPPTSPPPVMKLSSSPPTSPPRVHIAPKKLNLNSPNKS